MMKLIQSFNHCLFSLGPPRPVPAACFAGLLRTLLESGAKGPPLGTTKPAAFAKTEPRPLELAQVLAGGWRLLASTGLDQVSACDGRPICFTLRSVDNFSLL